MSIEIVPGPADVRVLEAGGEIDIAVVALLMDRLDALVTGADAVVLDMSPVSFLDSSGLRLVDRLARECGVRAVPFRVAAAHGSPSRRVLEIVGMTGDLVTADRDAAEAAVRAERLTQQSTAANTQTVPA